MQRNLSIDLLRFILSILIIALHTSFLHEFGIAGDTLRSVTRCAVPLFLMISGYYLFDIINDRKKVRKYILRVLLLYFIWMLVYFPMYADFSSRFNVIMFFFTWIFGFFHLWYLVALLLAVSMLYFFVKNNFHWKRLMIIAIGLFMAGWIIQTLKILQLPSSISLLLSWNFPYRNFLFIGFPFVYIGFFIRSKESRLTSLFSLNKLMQAGILFLLLLLAESYINDKIGAGFCGGDIYIFLLFLCPVIFLFTLRMKKTIENNYLANYSSGIYFIHPLIIYMMSNIFNNLPSWNIFILVTVFSIMLSSTLIMINNKLVRIL